MLTFDLSRPGRIGTTLPPLDVPEAPLPSNELLRDDLTLPELSQMDVVRYFTQLSQRNFSIDTGFYPLGSCSMKYNPRVNEVAARLPGLADVHPMQPQETSQGALALMHSLQGLLAEITGMDDVSLAPDAGAHGELAGILIASAYHNSNGGSRRRVLVPDSAHGTNPATAAMAGFEVESIPSNADGNLDLDALTAALDANGGSVAALMLTLPSTLGLFEPRIEQIAELLHNHGALLYGDGANMNALLGRVKPGDLGFDVFHLNLHKTFSTPHGGGGPGAGPIAVKAHLAPFLPTPHVEKEDSGCYTLATPERSIGRLGLFHGNFGVLVRAYAYIFSLGADGLRGISEAAVLNANYLLVRLRDAYRLPYDRSCMHEVVLSGSRQKAKGVKTLDIAKRLIDYGFHPPTIYFPLTVDEAMMIEPTESETKETLDAFCDAMLAIAKEAEETPDLVREAPTRAPLRRLDEATAARKPVLRWKLGLE
ncbi:MAG: aminomethyl-transferring glycine dehydrogenase subunit GcvPB [Chloroflexi bacterium]|nr:aminomethyl-transferring glycine dehydrogenase subunit GcvPB [Chloroflexota bacterium]